jgi:hypothetical protein
VVLRRLAIFAGGFSLETASAVAAIDEIAASDDGRYAGILRSLTGVQLLILDDWGLEPLDSGARRDLYEILLARTTSALRLAASTPAERVYVMINARCCRDVCWNLLARSPMG